MRQHPLFSFSKSFLFTFSGILLFISPLKGQSEIDRDTTLANAFYAQGNAALQQGNLDSMVHYMELAIPLFRKHDMNVQVGNSLMRTGYVSMNIGKLEEATASFGEAKELYSKALGPSHSNTLGAAANLSYVHLQKGEMDSVLQINLRCIRDGEQNPDINPQFLGNFYFNAGNAYNLLGKYIEATEMMDKSEQVIRERLGENHPGLIASWLGKASIFKNASLLDDALEYYEKAYNLQTTNPALVSEQVSVLANLGEIYQLKKNSDKSLLYYETAVEIARQQYGSSQIDLAQVLLNITRQYMELGEFEKAKASMEQSYSINQTQEIPQANVHIFYLLTRGELQSLMGKLSLADAAFEDAEQALKKQAANVGPQLFGQLYRAWALHEGRKGNFKLAFALIEQGKKALAETTGNAGFEEGNYLQTNYELFSLQGEHKKALNSLEEQMQLYIEAPFVGVKMEEIPPEGFSSLRNSLEILSLQANELEILFQNSAQKEYLDKWIGISQTGYQLLEKILKSYVHHNEKESLLKSHYGIFESAFKANWIQYQRSPSPESLASLWHISESAKSILLFQALHERDVQSFAQIPEKELAQAQAFRHQIALTDYAIEQQKVDSEKLLDLQNQLINHRRAQEQWSIQLEKNYQAYYQLKYGSENLSIQTVQKNLQKGDFLIEYFSSGDKMYCFLIGQKEKELIELEVMPEELFTDIDTFLSQLKTKSTDFQESAYSLYLQLVNPVIVQKSPRRLIIIPEDRLSALPFELLISEGTAQHSDYARMPFLIKQFPIVYNYAARFWHDQEAKQANSSSEGLLAISPEINKDFIADISEVTRDQLMPLVGAENEVQKIREIFGGNALQGALATEAAFRQQASNYKVLHLATHGIINMERPLYSKLIFSRGNDSLTQDDGLLHTYELLNMQLNAELTTLSACNTGTGELIQGEGMISLARGFAYAGCPNLVMSLWPVSDLATASLMTTFYEGLATNMNKDEALRHAKLTYLENSPPDRAHPYYWGAWMLVGNEAPLEIPTTNWLWTIAGFVLLLIGYAVYRFTLLDRPE